MPTKHLSTVCKKMRKCVMLLHPAQHNNHCASKLLQLSKHLFNIQGLHFTPAHNELKSKRILRLSLRHLQCTTFVVRSVILE